MTWRPMSPRPRDAQRVAGRRVGRPHDRPSSAAARWHSRVERRLGDSARRRAVVWATSPVGPVQPVREHPLGARRAARRPRSPAVSTITSGRASTGRLRSASRRCCSRSTQALTRAPDALPGLRDDRQLLGQVGHDPLGRVGGGRRAHVGDVVDQRRVGLVADRADDRRACRRTPPGTAPRRRTAAGPRSSRRPGRARSRRSCGSRRAPRCASIIWVTADVPWTATLITRKSTRRPAAARVGQHVALGGAGPAGDQPDPARQERQPALAARVEQPLGGQQLLQLLEPGQQLAQADLADLVGAQRQACRGPGRTRAWRARRCARRRPASGAPRSSTSRLVVTDRLRSAEGSRRVMNTTVDARAPGDLRHLAVDPDPARAGRSNAPIFWLTTRTGHGLSGLDRGVSSVIGHGLRSQDSA